MSNIQRSMGYHIGQWLAKMYVGERGSGASMVEVPGWTHWVPYTVVPDCPCIAGQRCPKCEPVRHEPVRETFSVPCQWSVTN